jgi:transcriptional regulator with XRE-family HTH domain
MKEQTPGEILGAKVAARIREFRLARNMSVEELAAKSGLSVDEVKIAEEGREEMTVPTVKSIARAFGVHPAVLFMSPEDDPLAQMLEPQRAKPKDELQKLAGEIISRGWRASRGSA